MWPIIGIIADSIQSRLNVHPVAHVFKWKRSVKRYTFLRLLKVGSPASVCTFLVRARTLPVKRDAPLRAQGGMVCALCDRWVVFRPRSNKSTHWHRSRCLTGTISSWLVLIAMAKVLELYWFTVAYCIAITLLEGIVCLGMLLMNSHKKMAGSMHISGMVYRMNPFQMPQTFRYAQIAIIT